MRHLVLAVAMGAMLGFSLGQDLLGGDASIFSDDLVGPLQDLAGQTLLASNDVNIFSASGASSNPDPDLYSDPLLLAASTCDDRANADEEVLLTSKLRARDSPMCYSKDPSSKDSGPQGWLNKLPKFFGGSRKPVPEPEPEPAETQYFGFDRMGNSDKCSPPHRFNLCCKGDLDGNIDDFFYDEFAVPPVYYRVEDCYESMYMPHQNFRFIREGGEKGIW